MQEIRAVAWHGGGSQDHMSQDRNASDFFTFAHTRGPIIPINPKDPCTYIVYTWALKGFLYSSFRAQLRQPKSSTHGMCKGHRTRPGVGMLPPFLAVLKREYSPPLLESLFKDCSYKGEHPNQVVQPQPGLGALRTGCFASSMSNLQWDL